MTPSSKGLSLSELKEAQERTARRKKKVIANEEQERAWDIEVEDFLYGDKEVDDD